MREKDDGLSISHEMNAADIGERIRALMNRYDLSDNSITRYIDLVSEIGELGKAMLSNSEYSHERLDNTHMLYNEMGDCLFSLFALIDTLDIDAIAALNSAINKYEQRYQRKGSIGSDTEYYQG